MTSWKRRKDKEGDFLTVGELFFTLMSLDSDKFKIDENDAKLTENYLNNLHLKPGDIDLTRVSVKDLEEKAKNEDAKLTENEKLLQEMREKKMSDKDV